MQIWAFEDVDALSNVLNAPVNIFILGINSSGDKILKFTSKENYMNKTISWEETEFLDLNDPEIQAVIKNNIITEFNLYPYDYETQVRILF